MKKIYFGIFLIASLGLNFIYFKSGNFLGGGETGIPFYDSERMLQISDSSWNDAYLGIYVPQAVANIPFFKMFVFFQNLGINRVFLQYGFFAFMFFITLCGTYLLIEQFFPKTSGISKALASFFYLFNPFATINIWGRFLLNFMLFYSVLPIMLWLFIVGLKRKRFVYAFVGAIMSVAFSYAFSSPIQVSIYWLILFLIAINVYLNNKSSFVIKYFLVYFTAWLFSNFWWLYQLIIFQASHSSALLANTAFAPGEGNLLGFTALSQTLGKIKNLFLLQHGLFYKVELNFIKHWPLIFNTSITIFIQWAFILTVLYVSAKLIRKSWVNFLQLLFLFGIFLSKGNSKPFGEFFNYLFINIGFLQIFRNPFEKLGIILPLSLAPLVALTIHYFSEKTRNRFAKNYGYYAVFFCYIVLFLGYPFITGLVYSGTKYPLNDPNNKLEVKVPEYYKELDTWLNHEPGEFRYLMLPVTNEGAFYNWEKGYGGVELSGLLLKKPGIASVQGFPLYENISRNIEDTFLRHENFYKIARLLNLKYLILRPDVNYQLSTVRDPQAIREAVEIKVNQNEGLTKVDKNFGGLEVHTLPDNLLFSKIYTPQKVMFSDSSGGLEDIYNFDEDIQTILISEDKVFEELKDTSYGFVDHSSAFFEIPGPDFPVFTDAPHIFPHVSHSPSSRVYDLILLKEKITTFSKIGIENKTNWNLILLGKRLMEAKEAVAIGDLSSAKKAIENYKRSYPKVIADIKTLTITSKQQDENVWNELILKEVFSSHLYLINLLEQTSQDSGYFLSFKEQLKSDLLQLKILPYFDLIKTPNLPISKRVVYQFEVLDARKYNLSIPIHDSNVDYYEVPQELVLQIDNQVEITAIEKNDHSITLRDIVLEKGIHEISFNFTFAKKISVVEQIVLDVGRDEGIRQEKITIPEFNASLPYDVSFKYRTIYGDGLTFSVRLDNDLPQENENMNFYYSKKLTPGEYFFDYTNYSYRLQPRSSASSAEIILSTQSWNNCKRFLPPIQWPKCKEPYLFDIYNRSTKVMIEHLEISPGIPKTALLVSKSTGEDIQSPVIRYTKISPEKYVIHVDKAVSPYLLIFSELYNDGWSIRREDGTTVDFKHSIANYYANGWWVNKLGNYDLVLEFEPEYRMKKTFLVSNMAILLNVILVIIFLVKKKV